MLSERNFYNFSIAIICAFLGTCFCFYQFSQIAFNSWNDFFTFEAEVSAETASLEIYKKILFQNFRKKIGEKFKSLIDC